MLVSISAHILWSRITIIIIFSSLLFAFSLISYLVKFIRKTCNVIYAAVRPWLLYDVQITERTVNKWFCPSSSHTQTIFISFVTVIPWLRLRFLRHNNLGLNQTFFYNLGSIHQGHCSISKPFTRVPNPFFSPITVIRLWWKWNYLFIGHDYLYRIYVPMTFLSNNHHCYYHYYYYYSDHFC